MIGAVGCGRGDALTDLLTRLEAVSGHGYEYPMRGPGRRRGLLSPPPQSTTVTLPATVTFTVLDC